MKQKRAKAYKRQMQVYQHAFGFRQPYQTLVDAELVLVSEKAGSDLAKLLALTLGGEAKVMITQCCMQALYTENNQEAITLARTFERRRCNHPPKDPLTPYECMKLVVDIKGANKHRYVVATQDLRLRRELKRVPGVPLVYVEKGVMIMAKLSTMLARAQETVEQEKLSSGLNDAGVAAAAAPVARKRKGPREPNPLSVKRKKTVEVAAAVVDKPKTRRKRGKKTADA